MTLPVPQKIELTTLPEPQLEVLHSFLSAHHAEVLPEDPPKPFSENLQAWRNPGPHEVWHRWWMLEQGADGLERVVGFADLDYRDDQPENPDSAWVWVCVARDRRRRGLGRHLLRTALETAQAVGRVKLFCGTNERIPAGGAFARSLGSGAKAGQEEHTNQLLLAELDRAYLGRALERAPVDRYELVWLDSEYPEHMLEALCEVFKIMNTAPRGELEFNDFQVTPAQLREDAEQHRALGKGWWLVLARDRQTGRDAGFTEIGWHPNRPHLVYQYGTGVHPEFRGHGLGAWLKSAMLERVLRERPEVTCVRTGNADSNVPMLRINHALGFRPFMARTEWQLDAGAVLEGLRPRAGVGG